MTATISSHNCEMAKDDQKERIKHECENRSEL